jgi:hypothetical protein
MSTVTDQVVTAHRSHPPTSGAATVMRRMSTRASPGGFGQQRPAGQHSVGQAPLRGRPTDRSCARRFAGDWTANGMSCPLGVST